MAGDSTMDVLLPQLTTLAGIIALAVSCYLVYKAVAARYWSQGRSQVERVAAAPQGRQPCALRHRRVLLPPARRPGEGVNIDLYSIALYTTVYNTNCGASSGRDLHEQHT
jgi:hypothetical protein